MSLVILKENLILEKKYLDLRILDSGVWGK